MEPGLHLSIADEAKYEREIGDFPYMPLVASLLYLSLNRGQTGHLLRSQGALSVHGKAWDGYGQSS